MKKQFAISILKKKRSFCVFLREFLLFFFYYNAETLKKCMLILFYLEFVSVSRSFDKILC